MREGNKLRIEMSPEGPVLYSGAKALYHPQNPRLRSGEAAAGALVPEQTLVLVPSPLFGYGLDVLAEKLPQSSRILCVEHDEELMAASLRYFPPELIRDSRISWIRAEEPDQVCRHAAERFGIYLFRRVVTVSLSRGYSLFPGFYRKVSARLLEMIQAYWRNRMTALHMGRLWMANLFTNLALLPGCRPITDLKFRRPLLIAGAGESLELHLDFLQARRRDFALLCVDTALPVLQAARIRPDLVIIAEAQFANVFDFTGFTGWSLPVAADITSYPGILRRFRGSRYIFLSRFAELSWFSRADVSALLPPFIPPLGSVGVMALYLAVQAAAEDCPIFLAGMDLRYQGGKPHAKASPSHSLFLAGQGRLSYPRYLAAWYARPKEKAPLARGGSVLADAVLASYKNVLQNIAGNRKNVFSLEGDGLDLGIPVLSHNEAEALLKQKPLLPASGSAPITAPGPWLPAAVAAFSAAQRAELESLAAAPAVRAEDLSRLDYLPLDFPENPPYPLGDPGFVRRCRERAAWYALRLRENPVNDYQAGGGQPPRFRQ